MVLPRARHNLISLMILYRLPCLHFRLSADVVAEARRSSSKAMNHYFWLGFQHGKKGNLVSFGAHSMRHNGDLRADYRWPGNTMKKAGLVTSSSSFARRMLVFTYVSFIFCFESLHIKINIRLL